MNKNLPDPEHILSTVHACCGSTPCSISFNMDGAMSSHCKYIEIVAHTLLRLVFNDFLK